MKTLALQRAELTGLDVVRSELDLRHDLHAFIGYVREREVKRAYRGNALSKPDALRIAKRFPGPDLARVKDELEDRGYSTWIHYVDDTARVLGLTDYDTKGGYAGYSSQEPVFVDNVIKFQRAAYEKFLARPLLEQERALLAAQVDPPREASDPSSHDYRPSYQELMSSRPLSRLDRFVSNGSATNILPSLDFPAARRFLFELLARCEPGVWLSTASLVEHLFAEHRYFLIPEKLPPARLLREKATRYGNFYETSGDGGMGYGTVLTEQTPDVFARVEGRYVERFLEGIPLELGYVDVAYGESERPKVSPSQGRLRAFRVRERLVRVITGTLAAPKVTVQPDFGIHVESELYPAGAFALLDPLAERVSSARTSAAVTVFRLSKSKVAARMAADPTLDVAALLTELTGRPLPQNVSAELAEWAGHSEMFVLYEGFALLEGDASIASSHTEHAITPSVRLVRGPDALFATLRREGLVPVRQKHANEALTPLPAGVQTVFPREKSSAAKQKAAKAVARRAVTVTLRTQHILELTAAPELFAPVRAALVEARSTFEANERLHTLTFPGAALKTVRAALRAHEGTLSVTVHEPAE